MGDHHADERDRKRQRKRSGPTTTNPGMRIVMRDLARKEHDRARKEHDRADEPDHGDTADDQGRQPGGRAQRADRDGWAGPF